MDKVMIPYSPQGHKVKVKVTKVISFLTILRVFCNLTLWNFYICLVIYYPAPRLYCFCGFCMFRRYSRIQHLFGALLSCPSAADPISLDMLVELGSSYFYNFGMVLTYPWAKHSWHDLLFGSRFLGWFLFLHWDPFEGIRCLLKLSLGLKIRGIDYLVSF